MFTWCQREGTVSWRWAEAGYRQNRRGATAASGHGGREPESHKILIWHNKLSHAGLSSVHNLCRQQRSAPVDNANDLIQYQSSNILPCTHNIPKDACCGLLFASCLASKSTKRSPINRPTSTPGPKMVLKQNDLASREIASVSTTTFPPYQVEPLRIRDTAHLHMDIPAQIAARTYDTNTKIRTAQVDPNYNTIVGVLRHCRSLMFPSGSANLVPSHVATNEEARDTSEESCGCAIWGQHVHARSVPDSMRIILPLPLLTARIRVECKGKRRGGRKPNTNTYLDDRGYPEWQHDYDWLEQADYGPTIDPSSNSLKIDHLPADKQAQLTALIKSKWGVFNPDGVKIPVADYVCHIDTGTATPVRMKRANFGPRHSNRLTDIARVKASGFLVLLKILLKDPTLANADTRKLLYLEKFRILNEKKIEKGYPDTFQLPIRIFLQ
eukprot:scaffold11461_cov58-Cyclotella_meneghiniana.AAC.5